VTAQTAITKAPVQENLPEAAAATPGATAALDAPTEDTIKQRAAGA